MSSGARVANIVLGVWLFISAFVWTHSEAQFHNTWIMGVIITVFAVAAYRAPQLRFVNTIAAVWLFFSVWALPTVSYATAWNNAIVAVLVFLISLVASRAATVGVPPPRRHATA